LQERFERAERDVFRFCDERNIDTKRVA